MRMLSNNKCNWKERAVSQHGPSLIPRFSPISESCIMSPSECTHKASSKNVLTPETVARTDEYSTQLFSTLLFLIKYSYTFFRTSTSVLHLFSSTQWTHDLQQWRSRWRTDQKSFQTQEINGFLSPDREIKQLYLWRYLGRNLRRDIHSISEHENTLELQWNHQFNKKHQFWLRHELNRPARWTKEHFLFSSWEHIIEQIRNLRPKYRKE